MLKLKWLAVLVLVFSMAQPGIADDLSPVVGIWKLVSFEREYQAGGEREYPMGHGPQTSSRTHFWSGALKCRRRLSSPSSKA